MATGKDIAKFVSMVTGNNDFLKMYEESEEMNSQLKNEAKENFSNLLNRMNEVSKSNFGDFID